MSNLSILKEKGIFSPYARDVMSYTATRNGAIEVDHDKTARRLAKDAKMSTAPATGVPSSVVTYLDPRIVTVLFAPTNATKLFPEVRVGTWADSWQTFPVEEITGGVTPYADASSAISSDVNYNFPSRQSFVFETTIQYGQREMDVAGKAGIQLASRKQLASASVLKRASNSFYLLGVKGLQVYGALNDPNLPATESPRAFMGKTTWEEKATQADPTTGIYGDIQHLIGTLIGRNAGLVDQNTRMVLAVAPSRFGYLTMSNTYGKTALSILLENYPNIEVIQLPELETQAGKMLYLTVPELDGENTAENSYSEKMRFSNIENRMSVTLQKAVGATWGCVIKRPNLIATMTGI